MNARLLLEVALRVLGFWLLCMAPIGIASWLWYAYAAYTGSFPNTDWVLATSSGIAIVLQFVLAGILIGLAPRIAARFYPLDAATNEISLTVGPGNIYHVACFVLGAYLFTQCAVSTFGLLGFLGNISLSNAYHFQLAASALVYAVSSLILIFGGQRIGHFVASLRYDPDSVPQQQFSLKLLLIITGIVAVVLGAIRIMTIN